MTCLESWQRSRKDLWMCLTELCLGLKSLARATKKQNRKQKHQLQLPLQMDFQDGFRDTQAHWYSGSVFTTGWGWPRPFWHFPSDRLKSQDKWFAWKISFLLPLSLPMAASSSVWHFIFVVSSVSGLLPHALDILLISPHAGSGSHILSLDKWSPLFLKVLSVWSLSKKAGWINPMWQQRRVRVLEVKWLSSTSSWINIYWVTTLYKEESMWSRWCVQYPGVTQSVMDAT